MMATRRGNSSSSPAAMSSRSSRARTAWVSIRVPKLRKVPVLLEVGDWLFGGRGGVEFRLRGTVEFVECLLAGLLLGSELLQGGQGGGRKTAETKMKMPVWLAQNLKTMWYIYVCMALARRNIWPYCGCQWHGYQLHRKTQVLTPKISQDWRSLLWRRK